jgi:large repetitive protein
MKKVFLYISIGIILLSIPVTVFLVGRSQEIRKRAAPASTLSLIPATVTKKVGETFKLEVKLDTAGNQVMTVQITILYDPAKLAVEDITNGPMAPSIRVSGKANPNGSATITVGAKDTITPITGTGTVAVVTMRAVAATTTPISVKFSPHPDTYANALNETSSVIIGLTGSNVIVLNADGTQGSAASSVNTSTQSGTLETTPGATLTPTPTTIPESTGSGQATQSALLIQSPANNEDVTSTTPSIQGKGVPNSTITVVIHSDPVTDTVTVDANGNWVYTPKTALSPGTHTVEAMYTDPTTGQTQTRTITFVVAASGGTTEEVSTGSAIPVSGTVETTILIISLGALLFTTGALLPLFIR